MRFFIGLLVAALGALVSTSSHARGPYGSISVGNWHGGAYTNDTTGAFTHCAAGSTYASGIYFVVSISDNGSWRLGFTHESWRLTPGEAFPLALTFDAQQPFNVYGTPIGAKLVSVEMPVNSALISQFRKAKTMSAFAQGQLFQFNLNQTAQLLPSLLNCVLSVKKNGLASAGEFAVAAKPAAAVAPPPGQAAPDPAQPKQGKNDKGGKARAQSGTGFVVSSNGHVVTNHHVIEGCSDISGNLTGEASVKLRLVSGDEINDLALLQAPSPFKDVVTIRANALRSGDSVVAIGFPFHGFLSSDFTVTTGIVSSLSGLRNDTRHLQISAAVQPGNSGGPLLDTEGTLVGVVSGKLDGVRVVRATGAIPENINFAIKTGALRDFLDNSVVPYQTTDAKADAGKKDLSTADIARNARGYTLLITCTGGEQSAGATAKKREN